MKDGDTKIETITPLHRVVVIEFYFPALGWVGYKVPVDTPYSDLAAFAARNGAARWRHKGERHAEDQA